MLRSLLLIGTTCALQVACAPAGEPAGGDGDLVVDQLVPSLVVRVGGDTVRFTLEVRNAGPAAVRLGFATAQRYDFVVRSETGAELWRWSSDRSFAQQTGEEAVAAGASLVYEATWVAPAGARSRYEVEGRVVSDNSPVELTAPFEAGAG